MRYLPALALLVVICLLAGCVSSAVRYSAHRESSAPSVTQPPGSGVRQAAVSYLGTPYAYGGMSKKGIDCSGLVCLVFRDAGIPGLPHSTKALVHRGKVVSLAQVKPGDLLFFHTGFFRTIDHVGICIGDNRFIHASIQLGVIESSMDDNYYRSRFSQARRLF